MKKILSFVLVLCMVMGLVLKPSAAFAAGTTSGITDITDTELNSGKMVVRTASTDSIVIDGLDFTNGTWLLIYAKGKDVTIQNCTFSDAPATYEYACTIYNAGNVTLTNNTFTRSYRGFNVVSDSITTPKINATRNVITLKTIPDQTNGNYMRNVGIQLAGPNWNGSTINITGNTFTNAYTAIRIHDTFSLASNASKVMTISPNTMSNVVSYISLDPNYKTEKDATIQTSLEEVMAANPSPITVNANNTQVSADADEVYTIIIPTSVDFGKIQRTDSTKVLPFTVRAVDTFINGTISVKLFSLADMTNGKGGTLAFTLNNSNSQVLSGSEFCTFSGDGIYVGSVTCDPNLLTKPGSYTGTMTFEISLK